MVDADNAEWEVLATSWQLDRSSGLVKCGDHIINGNRVVRVRAEVIISKSKGHKKPRRTTYVSALTSQTTDSCLFGEARVSALTNGGIFAER